MCRPDRVWQGAKSGVGGGKVGLRQGRWSRHRVRLTRCRRRGRTSGRGERARNPGRGVLVDTFDIPAYLFWCAFVTKVRMKNKLVCSRPPSQYHHGRRRARRGQSARSARVEVNGETGEFPREPDPRQQKARAKSGVGRWYRCAGYGGQRRLGPGGGFPCPGVYRFVGLGVLRRGPHRGCPARFCPGGFRDEVPQGVRVTTSDPVHVLAAVDGPDPVRHVPRRK